MSESLELLAIKEILERIEKLLQKAVAALPNDEDGGDE